MKISTRALYILIATITFGQAAGAAILVNLGHEFEEFLSKSQGHSKEQIETNWEIFESRHQEIYDESVYRKSQPGWEDRIRKKRDWFFAKLPTIAPQMLEVFHSAEKLVEVQESKFKVLFPDLAPDIPVIFLPSVQSFNGKVTDLKEYGRSVLLIGVDMIVDRNDNLNVLFSHEFFHAYHGDRVKGPFAETMATPLWLEGFATYISGVLNPNESDDVLLMQADLGEFCDRQDQVANMAKLYLKLIETDGETTYADWFYLSGKTLPVRRGYCLGLKVVRELAKSHQITEMVTWDGPHYTAEIISVLKSWANDSKD